MKYERDNILYWAEATLYQVNNQKWYLVFHGNQPFNISGYSFRSVTRTTAYIFPVVAQTYVYQTLAIKVLFPPYLQFQRSSHYIYGYGLTQNYVWTWKNNVTQCFNPNPCLQCGWYCQQDCHSWNSDLYLK